MKLILTPDTAASADWTDTGFECAAWYQDWKAQPGEYPVVRNLGRRHGSAAYLAAVEAVSGNGYFAGLWHGVPVGREPYDKTKHAGKPGVIRVRLTACALITDPRVVLEDGEYGDVLAEAIVEAEKAYEWYQTYLRQAQDRAARYTAIDKPMVPAYEYEKLAEAASLLSRLYSTANSRAQKGYEGTRLERRAS